MTTTPAARDNSEEVKAFHDWAWNKKGETIGRMDGLVAGVTAWLARAALAESEMAEAREQVADARRTGQYWKDEHAAANTVIDELRAELARVKKFRDEWEKTCLDTKQRFKNFHSSLCDRFSYTHDDKYWWRDLISLEEHIAKAAIDAARGVEG